MPFVPKARHPSQRSTSLPAYNQPRRSVAAGVRLGPYEVLSSLGAGGTGEVYRARDTNLGRDVALEILPDSVASDGDRVVRFRREAQILASLNHPLIAAIYGVEDSGATPVLVLELVEGVTLAERIGAGPLPLGEALIIAHQIAQALEAAHERGIVHRDLKPPDIKLRPDGTVKSARLRAGESLRATVERPCFRSAGNGHEPRGDGMRSDTFVEHPPAPISLILNRRPLQ
jgi:serine/threonine protein kinase